MTGRRRSLRVRVTATFALCFIVGGLGLLTAAYLIVARSTGEPVTAGEITSIAIAGAHVDPSQPPSTGAGVRYDARIAPGAAAPSVALPPATILTTRAGAAADASGPAVPLRVVQAAQAARGRDDLRNVLWWFAGAFIVIAALSVAIGWHVAGRALRPLRQITATARAVSSRTLSERIAIDGPRDELRELAETFDAMLDRLQRSFLAQRRFVASASHELRTPLAMARMEAEVALAEPDGSRAHLREALHEIDGAMERGGELVEALLQLAQADDAPRDGEPVDVAALLGVATEHALPAAAAAGVALEVSDATTDAELRGRPALLRALIDNLLANAIAYNDADGWVRARLEGGGATRAGAAGGDATGPAGDDDHGPLRLTVANTGPPVDPATVDDLFEPFVRAEPSRSRRSGGAGLGLAIVRTVAAAHGGHVEAAARDGGGLTVTIVLPRHAAEDPPAAAPVPHRAVPMLRAWRPTNLPPRPRRRDRRAEPDARR